MTTLSGHAVPYLSMYSVLFQTNASFAQVKFPSEVGPQELRLCLWYAARIGPEPGNNDL